MLKNFQPKTLKTMHDITVTKYNLNDTIPEKECVKLVTSVASVCYKSEDKSIGSKRLFNMLMKEGAGNMPSSALEFVPIAIPLHFIKNVVTNNLIKVPKTYKYGYVNGNVWISNMRALQEDYLNGFYTERQYNIIMNNPIETRSNIYKIENINMYTFGQLVRHRECSFLVKSRRYTSNDKNPFTFNLEGIKDKTAYDNALWICDNSLYQYKELIGIGLKPQLTRGILPQFATTELWFKFTTPESEANFLELRTSKKSQPEIRELAFTIKEMK